MKTMKTTWIRSMSAVLLAGVLAPAGADDFGLDYDVERVPSAQLSLADCAAAIRRASEGAGYRTRAQQDQGRLVMHVAGPEGDGKALLSYCIQAGTRTVWVVQALDYSGPGGSASAGVMRAVAAELRASAGMTAGE